MFVKLILTLILLTGCYGGPSKLGDQNGTGSARLYAPSAFSDINGVRSYVYNPDSQIDQVFKGSASGGLGDASVTFSPGSLASSSVITLQTGASVVTALSNNALGVAATGISSPLFVSASNTNSQSSNPFVLALPLSSAALDGIPLDGSFKAVFALIYKDGKIYELLTDDNLDISNNFVKIKSVYFGSYQAVTVSRKIGTSIRISGLAKIRTRADEIISSAATPASPNSFNLISQVPTQNAINVDTQTPAFLGFSNPIDLTSIQPNVTMSLANTSTNNLVPPIVSTSDLTGFKLFPPDGRFAVNAWHIIKALSGLKDKFGQILGTGAQVAFKTREGVWQPTPLVNYYTNAAAWTTFYQDAQLISVVPGQTYAYWTDLSQNTGFTSYFDGANWRLNGSINSSPTNSTPLISKFFMTSGGNLGVVYQVNNSSVYSLYSNILAGSTGTWGTPTSLSGLTSANTQVFDVVTNVQGRTFVVWERNIGTINIESCEITSGTCGAVSTLYNIIPSSVANILSLAISGDANPVFVIGLKTTANCYGFSGVNTGIAVGYLSTPNDIGTTFCDNIRAFYNGANAYPGIIIFEDTSGPSVKMRTQIISGWEPEIILLSTSGGMFKTKQLNSNRIVIYGLDSSGVSNYIFTDGVNTSAATTFYTPSGGSFSNFAVALNANDLGDVIFAYSLNASPTNFVGMAVLDHDGVTLHDNYQNLNSTPGDHQLVASIDNSGNAMVAFEDFTGTQKIQSLRLDSSAAAGSRISTKVIFDTNVSSSLKFGNLAISSDNRKGNLGLLHAYCVGSSSCTSAGANNAYLNFSLFN